MKCPHCGEDVGHVFPANSKFAVVNMPPGSAGEDVVAALKNYTRRDGPQTDPNDER